jgi:hypothetical protein
MLYFIRLGIIFALILVCWFYLKKVYGYEDKSWIVGLRVFLGLGLGVFFFEILMARFCKEYLIPIMLGVLLGSAISMPLIDWVKNLSFLSPVLQNFPWPSILRLVLIFFAILFVAYWSQEQFCWNKISLNLRSRNSKDFQFLRWIFRITVGVVFLIMLFSSLNAASAGYQNTLIIDMSNLGYDFDLELEKSKSFVLLPIWISFGLLLVSEWLFGNLYLRWLWVLAPAIVFAMIASNLGIEILGTSIISWLPSDLFQLFLVALCGYLGFSWSLRSMMAKSYRLPFLKINFEP